MASQNNLHPQDPAARDKEVVLTLTAMARCLLEQDRQDTKDENNRSSTKPKEEAIEE